MWQQRASQIALLRPSIRRATPSKPYLSRTCNLDAFSRRSPTSSHCNSSRLTLHAHTHRRLIHPCSVSRFQSHNSSSPLAPAFAQQQRFTTDQTGGAGSPAANSGASSSVTGQGSGSTRLDLTRLLPVGFLGGFLGACTGLGGAIVIIPGLSSFTSLSPHKILGTSTLVCATLACSVGALSFLAQGYVDFGLAATIAGSGAATAFVGARVSDFVNGRALQRLTGVFLLVLVPSVLQARKDRGDDEQGSDTPESKEVRKPFSNAGSWSEMSLKTHLPYIIAGGMGGFLQGLLGVGSGIVPMAYLSSNFCDIEQHVAVGTVFAATVPMGLAGTIAHYRRGNIHPRAALWLSVATLSAMFIGSQVVSYIDEKTLRQIFGALLAVSAARMVVS